MDSCKRTRNDWGAGISLCDTQRDRIYQRLPLETHVHNSEERQIQLLFSSYHVPDRLRL